MPKTRTPQDILDSIFWLNKLADTPWNKGILDTAVDLKREIDELEAERKKVADEIDGKIRKRMKVLRALPGRAEREASLIYTDEQVRGAKKTTEEIAEG